MNETAKPHHERPKQQPERRCYLYFQGSHPFAAEDVHSEHRDGPENGAGQTTEPQLIGRRSEGQDGEQVMDVQDFGDDGSQRAIWGLVESLPPLGPCSATPDESESSHRMARVR
jgi:hypothetical protein